MINLWFTFFHEAAHILLHRKKLMFLELNQNGDGEEEAEANQFAADVLIPSQYSDQLLTLANNRAEVSQFARKDRNSTGYCRRTDAARRNLTPRATERFKRSNTPGRDCFHHREILRSDAESHRPAGKPQMNSPGLPRFQPEPVVLPGDPGLCRTAAKCKDHDVVVRTGHHPC